MAPRAVSLIPRPSDAEFRHLQNARQDDIARALTMTPEEFKDFKKQLYEKVHVLLDCSIKLEDQDPSTWAQFKQWACGAMPSLASKYEDFWPVDLCVRHKLCKRIASDRHRFRVAMENYKQKRALSATVHSVKASTPSDEVETPLGDFPPSYEEITGRYCAADEQMHPDAVPEVVEDFLKCCDFDFGYLTGAFVTSRAGLFNMERLELIATWPAALRRDHFERHFSSVLDDVEIEVLNMRFSGLKQARR